MGNSYITQLVLASAHPFMRMKQAWLLENQNSWKLVYHAKQKKILLAIFWNFPRFCWDLFNLLIVHTQSAGGYVIFFWLLVVHSFYLRAVVFFPDMRRDVQEVFRMTPHEKQVMMFSATLAKEIRPVCKKFMQDVIMPPKFHCQVCCWAFIILMREVVNHAAS